jgi:hypothetical protein
MGVSGASDDCLDGSSGVEWDFFPAWLFVRQGYGSYRVDNNYKQLSSPVHPFNITQLEMLCIMDTSAGMYHI